MMSWMGVVRVGVGTGELAGELAALGGARRGLDVLRGGISAHRARRCRLK